MNKLLKLSNIAINVSHISKISIYNNKYTIHLVDFKADGLIIYGSGGLTTTNTIVEIKKDNHPDYFKVSEYILRHSI
jgi:hypothetical protein